MFTLGSTVHCNAWRLGNPLPQTAGVCLPHALHTVLLLRRCACSTVSTLRCPCALTLSCLVAVHPGVLWCMGGRRVQQPLQFRPLLTLHAPALLVWPALLLSWHGWSPTPLSCDPSGFRAVCVCCPHCMWLAAAHFMHSRVTFVLSGLSLHETPAHILPQGLQAALLHVTHTHTHMQQAHHAASITIHPYAQHP